MADPLKDIKRQLKIKTGTVTRIAKDLVYYQKEFDAQKARIEKIKADPTKDDHDVRKQEEVLAETEQMFPDAKARLAKALVDLETAIAESEEEAGMDETEEMKLAKEALEKNKE